jgi:hypothetical protein
MVDYFERTKPADWILTEAFAEIKKLYPDNGFNEHIFKLQQLLLDIK